MKFCPMCGEKIPIASARFCRGCGVNLADLQSSQIETTPTASSSSKGGTQSTHCQANTRPEVFDLQNFVNALVPKYGLLSKVYFNVRIQKNQTKIASAQKAYAPEIETKDVIFVFDDTLFGSAKDGFLVTEKSIYVHNLMAQSVRIDHNQIENFAIKEAEKKKHIFINDTIKIDLTAYKPDEMEKVLELLREITATFSSRASVISTTTSILPPRVSSPRQNTNSPRATESERNTRAGNLSTISQQENNNGASELKEYIRSLAEDYDVLPKIYFSGHGNKSLVKINGAQKSYATGAVNETTIFVFDDTAFGAADDGFLVTDKKIYVHNMDEEPFVISHGEVNSFAVKKQFLNRRIVINGSREINLTSYSQDEAEVMIDLLEEIKEYFFGQTPVTSTTTSTLPSQGTVSSLRQDSNSSRVAGQEQNRRDFDLDDLSDLADMSSSNRDENEGSSWNFFDDDD